MGYAVDGSGRPILCLSGMAEHTGNLLADPRSSLMVVATAPAGGDPLARARVTLVGDLVAVAPAEQEDVRRTYMTAHPEEFYSEHADALVSFCRVLGNRPGTGWAEMVHVDRPGFDDLTDTPQATRAAMIALLTRARSHDAGPARRP